MIHLVEQIEIKRLIEPGHKKPKLHAIIRIGGTSGCVKQGAENNDKLVLRSESFNCSCKNDKC